MAIGAQFDNGIGATCHTHNWRERLTVIRVAEGYAVTRYLVTDRYGRHGWAY